MAGFLRPGLFAALAASILSLSTAGLAPAAAQQSTDFRPEERGSRRDRDRDLRANPSKVVATEMAFARLARERGQWTAFAEYAADGAVMFVPERVNAREWLRKQKNPAEAVRWQPHHVWSSCDGTLAVTKGAWQKPDGSTGYFTTVWQRGRKGDYKWIMDQGDVLEQPLQEPVMIGATAAACRTSIIPFPAEQAPGPADSAGTSRDGTLHWQVSPKADGSRSVLVRYWDGTEWQTAISEQVPGR